jgi:hypothetical protein
MAKELNRQFIGDAEPQEGEAEPDRSDGFPQD